MKKPEEIKKGLEKDCGECDEENFCPYIGIAGCVAIMHADALALIRQLETENAELQSTYGQVKKALSDKGFSAFDEILKAYDQVKQERDAAVRDCARFPCYTCKERENRDNCCQCKCESATSKRSHHEWRGPCEENGVQKEENT